MRIKLRTVVLAWISLFSNQLVMAGPRTQTNQVSDFFNNAPSRYELEHSLKNEGQKVGSSINADAVCSHLSSGVNNAGAINFEAKALELGNTAAGNLEQAGRSSAGYDEFHRGNGVSSYLIDHNSPGVRAHQSDVNELANKSGQLLAKLTESLRQHGIDCQEVAAKRELKTEWFVDLEQHRDKQVVYDKFYCEHLRNQYSCHDELTVTCQHFAEKMPEFNITGYSPKMIQRQLAVAPIKKFRFEVNYGGGGGANRFGGGRVGGFINKNSGATYDASEDNWTVSFNLGSPLSTVNRLELTDLSYGTFLMIKLNGAVVMVGPTGGNNLYLNGHHEEVTKGKKKYGGKAGKRMQIVTKYPRVNTGVAAFALGLHINGSSHVAGLDLKPHMRQGGNVIELKAISLGGNNVSFNLEVSERSCLNWKESWHERCTLNMTEPY